jgi:UDP:flavonoid glycosyltransferase YjiC (YdhE family)
MKVLLAPYGSRGDVEPLVALGCALRAHGHSVMVVAPADFSDFVPSHGLEYRRGGGLFRDAFDGTQNEWFVMGAAMAAVPEQFAAMEAACAEFAPDAIVSSMLHLTAPTVAALHGVPQFTTIFCPNYLRSRLVPFVGLPMRRAPWLVQRAVWAVQDMLTPRYARPLNRLRSEHGLPPVSSLHRHVMESGPVFLAADPALAPAPADGIARSPVAVHQTGAWRLPPSRATTPGLDAFLAAGEAPIYVGFGSMVHRDASKLSRLVRDAVERAGVRAVLGSGWTGLGAQERPRDSIVLGETPHDLVFPRMAAIVHHGGAGTTTAAALAGRPQVIVPHLGDQYYHGYRIEELGVGPAPIFLRSLTAAKLSRAIVQAKAEHSQSARELASRMTHDGADRACEVLYAEAQGVR